MPSCTACHRFAARVCVDGCDDSRIAAAIIVYDSNGCSHTMRLALAAMSLSSVLQQWTRCRFQRTETPRILQGLATVRP
eukprot:2775471-Pleurochrysis_carterae.AAC.1